MPTTVAVAKDICCEYPAYSVPVTFDCALACTSIGWPMQFGVLSVSFFTDTPTCPAAGTRYSSYIPNLITIGLGCRPGNPSPEGIWQGETGFSNTLIIGPPAFGMRYKIRAVMTVGLSGTVNVVVTLFRLVPNAEYVPSPPDGSNVYIECGSFSATLARILGVGEPPLARNRSWAMGHDNLIAFTPTCDTDIHSATVALQLVPYKLGCDGTADGGTLSYCAFDTGYRTYSCLNAVVEPTTYGTFPAAFGQMGVNRTSGNNFGCFQGHNSATGAPTPVAADFTPSPIYPSPDELANCGCPGEDPVSGDLQQIQYALIAGYDVVVKSVNGSGLCVALREYGDTVWTIGTPVGVGDPLTTDIAVQTGHTILTYEFPDVTGSPRVILYGLVFPNGILAECVPIPGARNGTRNLMSDGEVMLTTTTGVTPPPPPMPVEVKKIVSVIQNPCIHLGNALEDVPSCGCGGKSAVKHECKLYGTCRVYSRDKTIQNCVDCPSYKAKEST